MSDAQYWVYILRCSNNSYYTGYTTNLIRRYNEHLEGTSKSKFTRSFPPIQLMQSWMVSCKKTAMRMEYFIKQLHREEKEKLISNPQNLLILMNEPKQITS